MSNDLKDKYVEYVNNIKLKDPKGNELTLISTNEGSYYEYLKSVIEESLNNFLSDTTFPYTPSTDQLEYQRGNDFPTGSCQPQRRGFPWDFQNANHQRRLDTYETASDYIASLNSDSKWITYDSSTNTAKISSVGDFVTHCKSASKDVGAFDDLSKGQAENKLFGIDGTTYAKHFDSIMAQLLNDKSSTYSSLSNWDSSYPTDYQNDLSVTDSLGNTIEYRSNMYNPMYYLIDYYDGYKKSDVADYFRINTGINQGDTSNVVEMNLYLALLNYGKNATFTTVWDQGHTEAERSGDANDNFISWVAGIEGSNSTSTSTTSTSTSTASTSTTSTSTISTSTSTTSTTSTNSSSTTSTTSVTTTTTYNSTINDDNPYKIFSSCKLLKLNYLFFLILFVILI